MALAECLVLFIISISIIAVSTANIRNTDDIDSLIHEVSYLLTLIEELEQRTDHIDEIIQRRE